MRERGVPNLDSLVPQRGASSSFDAIFRHNSLQCDIFKVIEYMMPKWQRRQIAGARRRGGPGHKVDPGRHLSFSSSVGLLKCGFRESLQSGVSSLSLGQHRTPHDEKCVLYGLRTRRTASVVRDRPCARVRRAVLHLRFVSSAIWASCTQ
jgi:hypothetical protein